MIFRNTFRLLFSNFSNVWKLLVYYLICIVLTFLVCGALALPIIEKLNQANVFSDFLAIVNNFFNNAPSNTALNLEGVWENFLQVINSNPQFTFNYVFLAIWLLFVFPFTLDLAQLPMGEVLYGYMTSQTKYSFTGRFIKTLKKSLLYSLVRFFVLLVFNVGIFTFIFLIIKLATMGNILYLMLDIALLACLLIVIAFKYTLFSCWMPAISVFDSNVFVALGQNFVVAFRKFGSIFSTSILLVILALVFNLIFGVFSFTVSFIVTIPITVFVFAIFQMVSFFSSQGMKFYVYPDMVISSKTFEEQMTIENTKYLL